EVVGDQDGSGAYRRGPGVRVRCAGPAVGMKRSPGVAAHFRKRSFRTVQEAGHTEVIPYPAGEIVTGCDGALDASIRYRPAGKADPGDDVESTEAGVGPLVRTQIDAGHRLRGERSDRVLKIGPVTGQGEHGAVVVRIGVHVEQMAAADIRQGLHQG